jgi:hypothetical protein
MHVDSDDIHLCVFYNTLKAAIDELRFQIYYLYGQQKYSVTTRHYMRIDTNTNRYIWVFCELL